MPCTGDHFVSTVLAAPKVFVIGDADDLDAMGKERLDSSASTECLVKPTNWG